MANTTPTRTSILLAHLVSGGQAPPVSAGEAVRLRVTAHVAAGNAGDDTNAGLFENDELTVVAAAAGPFPEGAAGMRLLREVLKRRAVGLVPGGAITTFNIAPDDPMHPVPSRDETLVMRDIPLDQLPAETRRVGAMLMVRGGGGGDPMANSTRPATVTAIDDRAATACVDLNDPIAGQTLRISVAALEVLGGSNAAAETAAREAAAFGPGAQIRAVLPDEGSIPPKVFTAEELRQGHGRGGAPIYLAVCSLVFDMTQGGAKFYGPGGPYGFLAGADATLCLARHSLDPKLKNGAWRLDQLAPDEEATLASFLRTFSGKYPIVGRLEAAA